MGSANLLSTIPVIMCGGAGSRLWPASTPTQPKPFLDLIGDCSLFAETVKRLFPLARGQALPIVVAGSGHSQAVQAELSALGERARIVLEPEPRDSAPAMAAAALVALRADPDAILAVVASDHHVPDFEAFRRAVHTAAESALQGRIVTLGVRPTWPSSAFGYIAGADQTGAGVTPVEAFVEKPAPEVAAEYIARGYLWNSGNFITRADVLLDEIKRYEPAILEAVEAAVETGRVSGATIHLGHAFCGAPKIAIDYAVMERTDRASVLPVDFSWSDVGSWDAVIDGGGGDRGAVLRVESDGGLIRAAPGVSVAVIGLPEVIVVANPGQVLVTTRQGAGRVREAADVFKLTRPEQLTLASRARTLAEWIRLRALPVWSSLGVSPAGAFHDALDAAGRPVATDDNGRVRLWAAYALRLAGTMGWAGPWAALIQASASARLKPDDASIDDLALALLAESPGGSVEVADAIGALLDAGLNARPDERDDATAPWSSEPLLRLFEAFLAWEAIEPDEKWRDRADRTARQALDLSEEENSFAASTTEGVRIVTPTQQFAMARLIQTWASRRRHADGARIARRLFDVGCQGLDATSRPVLETLRLETQTERLKAALVMAASYPNDSGAFQDEAEAALASIEPYLSPDGLWSDRLNGRSGAGNGLATPQALCALLTALQALAASFASDRTFSPPLTLS